RPPASEYDAEILSIVGKVMGSRTLQDELTDGLEWRAEPDSFMGGSGRLAAPPKSSLATTFGLGSSPAAGSSAIDLSARRNSMPMHRASSESRIATLAPGGSRASLSLDIDIEAVYKAYCALEKFRRDANSLMGSSYHPVSEVAQMHGRLSESEVWGICAKYSRANPSVCMLDHSTHSVMFSGEFPEHQAALVSAAATAPTPVPGATLPLHLSSALPPLGMSSGSMSQFGVEPRSTPTSQLSIITEDMLSAFSLQTAQTSSPIQMPQQPSQLQARSPMLGHNAPLLQNSTAGGLLSGSRVQPQSLTLPQTPTRPLIPSPLLGQQHQQALGSGYVAVAQPTTASMYFNPLMVPGAALQQQHSQPPLSAPILGQGGQYPPTQLGMGGIRNGAGLLV
ncbi:hypothetical protein EC988_006437, partial [Linderina pennispora]